MEEDNEEDKEEVKTNLNRTKQKQKGKKKEPRKKCKNLIDMEKYIFTQTEILKLHKIRNHKI